MAHRLCQTLLSRLPGALAPTLVSGGGAAASLAVLARRPQRPQQQRRPLLGGGSRAAADAAAPCQAQPEDSHLLQSILSGILAPYWGNSMGVAALTLLRCCCPRPLVAGRRPHVRVLLPLPPHAQRCCSSLWHPLPPPCPAVAESTPTAEAVVGSLEQQYPSACLGFDHFAFRTFGVS